MIDMQALMDGLGAKWQKERAATQMTLGGLIEILEGMPDSVEIVGLGELDSYRGYYSDLAFEPSVNRLSKEVLEKCKAAMGKVFTGYKGGDYVMGARTPLWVANYGDCGKKLMGINPDGSIETAEDEEF